MLKWLLVLVVAVVVLAIFRQRLQSWGLGRLPGDVTVRYRGRLIYLPITSTILVALLLSVIARVL